MTNQPQILHGQQGPAITTTNRGHCTFESVIESRTNLDCFDKSRAVSILYSSRAAESVNDHIAQHQLRLRLLKPQQHNHPSAPDDASTHLTRIQQTLRRCCVCKGLAARPMAPWRERSRVELNARLPCDGLDASAEVAAMYPKTWTHPHTFARALHVSEKPWGGRQTILATSVLPAPDSPVTMID